MDKIIKKYSDHPLRSWFIRQSLDYPKRTIIFSILLTLIVGSGAQFFIIDDGSFDYTESINFEGFQTEAIDYIKYLKTKIIKKNEENVYNI